MWRPSRILSRAYCFHCTCCPLALSFRNKILTITVNLCHTWQWLFCVDTLAAWMISDHRSDLNESKTEVFFICLQSCMTVLTKALIPVFTYVLTVLKNLGVFMNSCFTFNTLTLWRAAFTNWEPSLKPRQLHYCNSLYVRLFLSTLSPLRSGQSSAAWLLKKNTNKTTFGSIRH